MKVINNRLSGDKVHPFVPANAIGKRIKPDSIIIHYTAGPSGKATVNLFQRPNIKVSAHLVIHEDGTATQMVDFNARANHAGRSSWGGRSYFNNFSIGIEISNPGYLVKNPKGDGYVTWWEERKDNPKPVADKLIYEGKHRNAHVGMTHWHRYPQEQIDIVKEICRVLVDAYDIKYILGHEEIAPNRKTDPGPAFPLDELRKDIFGEEGMYVETEDELEPGTKGQVTTNLNIRQSPALNAEKVTDPIPKDTVVELLKETDKWFEVNYRIIGWVARDYITLDNSDDEGDGEVTASSLNIRARPESGAPKVAQPLPHGTKVFLIKQENHWYKVNTLVKGWVYKKYVDVIEKPKSLADIAKDAGSGGILGALSV